ncbi:DUF432 domain-containing protein [Balneolaceae bacterium YR4-1]|uniref:DUF432 domain-containing protein n=1 Tax=Halalkalibaculum roseum TaxID=2709311 RepID=A0A6M1T3D6_9BACT|nr:DUF432 domain-containing protein [Halalkalibaculum roseum]NGP77974.1 DUF432 domain-containing protein [Halalkalibaculum roseum]
MNIDKWGEFTLSSGEKADFFRLGDLRLWLKYKDEEIWIGHQYAGHADSKEALDSPPEDLEWARWAPKEPGNTIKLMPVFPDLPLVVNSEYPLRVNPGASIQIFTRIPVWLRISIGKNDTVLTELPSIKLSRTWFGTPIEGELCFWAITKARRSLSNVERKPHMVSCPIQITNKTEEDLNFDKFCFRVERLKLFVYNEELWSDETRIVYQGEEQYSDINMSGRLPKGMENAKLISPPRKPEHRSLATRTFKMIFDESFLFGK